MANPSGKWFHSRVVEWCAALVVLMGLALFHWPAHHDDPRQVTFTSHLGRRVADDPIIHAGETIVVAPDPSESSIHHESVIVSLPAKVPYSGDDALYYLRGYATGQAQYENGTLY